MGLTVNIQNIFLNIFGKKKPSILVQVKYRHWGIPFAEINLHQQKITTDDKGYANCPAEWEKQCVTVSANVKGFYYVSYDNYICKSANSNVYVINVDLSQIANAPSFVAPIHLVDALESKAQGFIEQCLPAHVQHVRDIQQTKNGEPEEKKNVTARPKIKKNNSHERRKRQ